MALFGSEFILARLKNWRPFGNPEKTAERVEKRLIRRASRLDPKIADVKKKFDASVEGSGFLGDIHKQFFEELKLLQKEEEDVLGAIEKQELVEYLRIKAIGKLMDPNNSHGLVAGWVDNFEKANQELARAGKPIVSQNDLIKELALLKNGLHKLVDLLLEEVKIELNEMYWLARNQTLPPSMKNFTRLDLGALDNELRYQIWQEQRQSRDLIRQRRKLRHAEKFKDYEEILKKIDEYIASSEKAEKMEAKEMSDLLMDMVYFYEKVHILQKELKEKEKSGFPEIMAEEMLKKIELIIHATQKKLNDEVDEARRIMGEAYRDDSIVNAAPEEILKRVRTVEAAKRVR
jgi:hypothetical protein